MRISDWSSDVCSSDLPECGKQQLRHRPDIEDMAGTISRERQQRLRFEVEFMVVIILDDREAELPREIEEPQAPFGPQRNGGRTLVKIGRASCRERVCQYV